MEKLTEGEQYVNQKTERSHHKLGDSNAERAANAREADRRLMDSFADVEYTKEGGFSQTFEKEIDGRIYHTEMSFSYDSECGTPKIVLEHSKSLLDLNRLRRLVSIRIESENYVLDSSEVPFPKSGIYFFDVNGLSDAEKWKYSHQGIQEAMSGIISGMPPSTPAGIITILHELGHFWRSDADNYHKMFGSLGRAYRKVQSRTPMSGHEKGMVLEEERSAWAVALKEAVEFLKPICDTEDVKKSVHFALSTYGKALKDTKTQG
jgi:hypothetical protein